MNANSIRARMTRGFAIYTALLMLTMCAVYFFATRYANHHAVNKKLHSEKKQLIHQLQDNPDLSAQALLAKNSADWDAEDVAALVLNGSGKVIAKSPGNIFPWPLHGDSWRIITLNYHGGKAVIGVPWQATEVRLRRRAALFLLVSAFLVVALSAGAWVVVGRTLLPLDGLTQKAQSAWTEGEHWHLEAPSDDREMVRLVDTLNELLARLEETAASRARFYAAAAHELRTPLQGLGGHLELALARQRSAEDYRLALEEGHQQAQQLTQLVQGLLLLNQLQTGAGSLLHDEIDLADICQTELARLAPRLEERRVQVAASYADDCQLSAPWSHVKMLLHNLLENAAKYADADSILKIGLDKSTFVLWNQCLVDENINPQSYLEPFFRADKARSSIVSGNGLGLAICQNVCEANGWQIRLRWKEGGLEVKVWF